MRISDWSSDVCSSDLKGAASRLEMRPQSAQATPERRYDIPAGPLAQALNRFADESGFQLVYGTEVTQDARTGGVVGTYTPEQALRRLLRSTGLRYRITNANTVTIERSGGREELGEDRKRHV